MKRKHKAKNCWCGGAHHWFGLQKRKPLEREPMSIEIRPELQMRLKLCALRLRISRATLVERLCLEGLPGEEFDWGALAKLREKPP